MEPQPVTGDARYSVVDNGLASLYNTQIIMLHSAHQALWQRYTAMLVAEAILMGSFGWVHTLTAFQVYFASGFGVVLCLAWLVTTVSGYKLYRRRLDATTHFSWIYLTRFGEHVNPIAEPQTRSRRQSGGIVRMALGVIGLFMLGHAFVLAHYLYYRFLFVEGPR